VPAIAIHATVPRIPLALDDRLESARTRLSICVKPPLCFAALIITNLREPEIETVEEQIYGMFYDWS